MRYTAIIAFAAITLRWLLHADKVITDGHSFTPIHLLALLLAVFFAQHVLLRSNTATTFPMLVRTGFRNAVLYALAIAVFSYALYTWIDPLYFPIEVNQRIDMAVADGVPETEARARMGAMFTPLNYATFTLIIYMAAGILFALVMGAVHHKVLRRLR